MVLVATRLITSTTSTESPDDARLAGTVTFTIFPLDVVSSCRYGEDMVAFTIEDSPVVPLHATGGGVGGRALDPVLYSPTPLSSVCRYTNMNTYIYIYCYIYIYIYCYVYIYIHIYITDIYIYIFFYIYNRYIYIYLCRYVCI